MPNQRRLGGIITLKINGEVQSAKGEFTVNYGRRKRTAIIGSGGEVVGYSEKGQVPSIEGVVTDRQSLDVPAMLDMTDGEVHLAFANGKAAQLKEAWFAGDGNVKTDEGDIDVRFEGVTCEEVR